VWSAPETASPKGATSVAEGAVFIFDDDSGLRGRFYRNGSLLSEVTQDFATTPMLANNQGLALGKYLNSSDGLFQGQLDEVRIWNDVRTLDEIRSNMFQTLKGNESGLAAYFRFDQDNDISQTTLFDITTNSNDGSLNFIDPSAAWVNSSAFNTWIGGDSTNWAAGGNWSRYSVPNASDNVGIHSDTGTNTTSITATQSVKNLMVASGAILSLESGGSLNVSGSIINYGTVRQTQAASGSTDITFLNIGNYGGLTINPNGTDLGIVTASIQGNQQCTSTIGDTVKRCYDITSDNPPASGAQIAFYFWDTDDPNNDCTHTEAFHWNGAAWSLLTRDTTTAPWVNGRVCGSMLQSIRVAGVTSFSPFVLDNTSPTAISLVSFSGSGWRLSPLFVMLGLLSITIIGLLWFGRKVRHS